LLGVRGCAPHRRPGAGAP